jgi:hypothetical protein
MLMQQAVCEKDKKNTLEKYSKAQNKSRFTKNIVVEALHSESIDHILRN